MADVAVKVKASEDTKGSRALVKGPGPHDFHTLDNKEGSTPDPDNAETKYSGKYDETTYYSN